MLRRNTCDRVKSCCTQIASTFASIVFGRPKPVIGSDIFNVVLLFVDIDNASVMSAENSGDNQTVRYDHFDLEFCIPRCCNRLLSGIMPKVFDSRAARWRPTFNCLARSGELGFALFALSSAPTNRFCSGISFNALINSFPSSIYSFDAVQQCDTPTAAPPISVMNSRRFIAPRPRPGHSTATWQQGRGQLAVQSSL